MKFLEGLDVKLFRHISEDYVLEILKQHHFEKKIHNIFYYSSEIRQQIKALYYSTAIAFRNIGC